MMSVELDRGDATNLLKKRSHFLEANVAKESESEWRECEVLCDVNLESKVPNGV